MDMLTHKIKLKSNQMKKAKLYIEGLYSQVCCGPCLGLVALWQKMNVACCQIGWWGCACHFTLKKMMPPHNGSKFVKSQKSVVNLQF